MILKTRPSNHFGLILLGSFIGFLGFAIRRLVGTTEADRVVAVVFSLVGMLGVYMFIVGVLALARRGQTTIVIDESGVELPAFTLFEMHARRLRIPRDEIASIAKHEGLKGRIIEITTTSGGKALVPARNYCDLEVFLDHCKKHGLPVG